MVQLNSVFNILRLYYLKSTNNATSKWKFIYFVISFDCFLCFYCKVYWESYHQHFARIFQWNLRWNVFRSDNQWQKCKSWTISLDGTNWSTRWKKKKNNNIGFHLSLSLSFSVKLIIIYYCIFQNDQIISSTRFLLWWCINKWSTCYFCGSLSTQKNVCPMSSPLIIQIWNKTEHDIHPFILILWCI